MLEDDSWASLVPNAVANFILEIDGVARLRELGGVKDTP
jgi:nicotinamide mononucleotide adenylyltransferase